MDIGKEKEQLGSIGREILPNRRVSFSKELLGHLYLSR